MSDSDDPSSTPLRESATSSSSDGRSSDEQVAATVGARAQLAGFWNAWFNKHEIEQAHAFAADHSEDECQAELDRLYAVRDGRLQQWRWSQ